MKVVDDFEKKKLSEAQIQKQRFQQWQREFLESQQRAREFKAYWERRHRDDKDLWRDKEFANAVDKMSRAGYKGEHGHHEVPEEDKILLDALYMQVTAGDYGTHRSYALNSSRSFGKE
ncbi:unnamed protein product [Heligmosomoides polygyrus]|uniref:Inhibitor_I29 domain-containing protein n=1 Tax=Heligmosomoides polygyrus TaxID=6339 RepID=A0A183F6H1_HELPZ|nr:unnamed protein product [Heligmosomoides polygyrus]